MVTGGKTGGADNLCAMLGGDSSGHQCLQRRRDPIVTRILACRDLSTGLWILIADCGQRDARATRLWSRAAGILPRVHAELTLGLGLAVNHKLVARLMRQAGIQGLYRVLTLVWALAFLATAVLGYIAVIAPSTSDWTNWILPIVLIAGVFKFTRWHSEGDRASAK
jgi:hypothetical protein